MLYTKAQSLYDNWKHGKRSTKATENSVRRLINKGVTSSQESDLLIVLTEIGVDY